MGVVMDNSGFVLVVSPDAQTVVRQGDLLFSSEADGEGTTYIVVQPSNASASSQPPGHGQGPPVQADKGAKPVGRGGVTMSLTTKHPDDLGELFKTIASSSISSDELEHLVSMTPPGRYLLVELDLNAPAIDLLGV
jgi:hypothetical protein